MTPGLKPEGISRPRRSRTWTSGVDSHVHDHMSGSIARQIAAIAAAVPAQVVALAADTTGAHGQAKRIRSWLDGVSTLAYVLTMLLWVLVFWRGILYPAFGGAKNLARSWGGPMLAGAWVVHLGIIIAALLVVSSALALRQPRKTVPGRESPADDRPGD
jgi:hypothetical protein